ncbi:MAG TPA: LuxR C-terminal-related transcriptional regulator, partial [Nevskiaceae bacterium]|nr:LuxR C-terminal-related transcriptional regulator [Nevskiaceae bacterium]
ARGRPAKALETLDEAESVGHTHGWERLLRLINWERVRRALVAGAVERAQAIAALMPPGPASGERILFSEDAESETLSRIRLAIQRMDYDAAAHRLTAEFARGRGRDYRQIKLHLLEAALHHARDERNAAHRSLRKALALAAPGGYVRCFLDEGDAVLQLLREAYQHLLEAEDADACAGQRAHIELLLQASGTDLSRARPAREAAPVEALTDREREILVFLANGVSNKEMAGRLFVSENTVKFHLKNIYSKLSVGSRLQAITAGRKLGLVQ